MSSAPSTKREERAQDRAMDRTIEETKDSTRKVIQEAKRELPEFTSAFHDYQEQNINAIKEITSDFLDSQKQVARSLRSASSSGQRASYVSFWNPAAFSLNAMAWSLGPLWASPNEAIEAYSTLVSNFAESSIAATRLSNELVISSMEATRASLQHVKNNSKAISKYMVDSAENLDGSSVQERR